MQDTTRSSQVELSLVTGCVDRSLSLYRLVASIQAWTRVPYELIISDACQTPLDMPFPNTRIIREWPRMGMVAGYNRAFESAVGNWVIWLNDDAEVQPCYDVNAIRFMEEHPEIGLGALYYREGKLPYHVNQHLGIVYANFGIISRKLGNEIGWFGKDLKMYGSDVAITFEVLLKGLGVADIPSSRVVHHSVQDATRIGNQPDRLKSSDVLHKKYSASYQKMQNTYRRHQHGVAFQKLGPNAIVRVGV